MPETYRRLADKFLGERILQKQSYKYYLIFNLTEMKKVILLICLLGIGLGLSGCVDNNGQPIPQANIVDCGTVSAPPTTIEMPECFENAFAECKNAKLVTVGTQGEEIYYEIQNTSDDPTICNVYFKFTKPSSDMQEWTGKDGTCHVKIEDGLSKPWFGLQNCEGPVFE